MYRNTWGSLEELRKLLKHSPVVCVSTCRWRRLFSWIVLIHAGTLSSWQHNLLQEMDVSFWPISWTGSRWVWTVPLHCQLRWDSEELTELLVMTVINASVAVTLLEQRPEKKFRLWAGFEPTTSATPVQCSLWTLSVCQKVYKDQCSLQIPVNVMVRMFFSSKMADSVMCTCRCLDV